MSPSAESSMPAAPASTAAPAAAESICVVDRMTQRRRNKICLRIIYIGLLNFLVYTLLYAVLGGDAHNGEVRRIVGDEGGPRTVYVLRGHFMHSLEGRTREVSREAWVYSYLHSISVLITSGAVVLSMLILARPHIIATMRDSLIKGSTFVAAFGTVVTLITSAAVVVFTWDMIAQLTES